MYMQDVLQTLNRFWSERGCSLVQPYHTEVGAGTSNPATFLRAVGPEPWWVGYVEPSIRPADGRYAENPNRLQHYHQYQVILKPSPQNVQELFLQSLEALGLDLTKHDFRFVEDNWQSPSLGAWGLGWEAWLDGMEVLQFTYFQECGGMKLDVRACELTYGVERICMYLQEKESVYDLEWAASGITYGDIWKASEIEFCKYNFEIADTDKLLSVFDMWEGEGKRLLGEGLIMPAYDHCLRLSHTFNLLDARGALSVAERGRFLLRCRTIAEACAKGFHQQREAMGFPLMRLPRPIQDPAPPAYDFAPDQLKATDTLLLEFGVEELPHKDITAVRDQAETLAKKILGEFSISHGPITLYITPRRITLSIADVPAKQPDTQAEVRGPKRAIAKDKDGYWTVPAQKFAEGRGATPDDIVFKQEGKDEYCFLSIQEKGKHIGEWLNEFADRFLRGLHFGKSMGWEDTTVFFSRPVRWLVALHGDTLVPMEWKLREQSDIAPERTLYSDRISHGHRRLGSGSVSIGSSAAYLDDLRGVFVLADRSERMTRLRERTAAECAALQLAAEDDTDLYEEICDLTEWPEPIVGAIPEEALSLPEEIIITPMKVHQRYIPVRQQDGSLSRYFICVANGEHDSAGRETIKVGNERVLNARLRDAKYFWDADLKTPLAEFAQRLSTIMFHQKLGTVADKVARIRALYGKLRDSLPPVDGDKIDHVFTLMKADLTTQMVFEFDSLEGVVGTLYAKQQGVDTDVADAILDHRLPRRAGDRMPQGELGLIAGILDRVDTLAGYFGIGIRVKGTSDPFGLRRNALALLGLIEHANLDLDVRTMLMAAAEVYGDLIENPAESVDTALAFIGDRAAAQAREQGYAYDYVAAALASHAARPLQFRKCLAAMAELDAAQVQEFAEQAKRMARIIKEPADTVDASLVSDDEKALLGCCGEPSRKVHAAVHQGDFAAALAELLGWLPAINTYFEKVMVNDPDDTVRRNRHALLRDVLTHIKTAADFTLIEKKDVA